MAYLSSSYPKIFIAKSSNTDWEGLNEALDLLEKAARDEDVPTIYKILCAMGIGYNENLPERLRFRLIGRRGSTPRIPRSRAFSRFFDE